MTRIPMTNRSHFAHHTLRPIPVWMNSYVWTATRSCGSVRMSCASRGFLTTLVFLRDPTMNAHVAVQSPAPYSLIRAENRTP